MMLSVGDGRRFVDFNGMHLVPDGDAVRERPTVVMLHGNGGHHPFLKEDYARFTEYGATIVADGGFLAVKRL